MVMVGCTFSDCPTTRSPTWLKFCGALADHLEGGFCVVAGAALGAEAEQGRKDRRLEQHAPAVIALVIQAGIEWQRPSGHAISKLHKVPARTPKIQEKSKVRGVA